MDYEQIRAFRNTNSPYANRLGVYVEELRPGYARAVKAVTEEDLNPMGIPHGGVYFSLADTACGSVMAAYGTTEARELQSGNTICVLEARITGEQGELLALGTFTFRRLKPPIQLGE